MKPDAIKRRLEVVVEEQLREFDALKGAVLHVKDSSPSSVQRVILCNTLVVGLTARIEESFRQLFVEYLKIVEECSASFHDLRSELRDCCFEAAVHALKSKADWDEAKRKNVDLTHLLSGASDFKLEKARIVNNQGNMRSKEVTAVAKRFGVHGVWELIAQAQSLVDEMGEDDLSRLEGLIIKKWNELFDERDNVVHRVSQANGWSADFIVDYIEFLKKVVTRMGVIVSEDCLNWHVSLK
ncbi:MAG: hypothetical protein INF48_06165 [Rhodobacter sp.]|nr:hypothetical protein [Rhodobacter sp.]